MDGDQLFNAALAVFAVAAVFGVAYPRDRTWWLTPVGITGLGLSGCIAMAAEGRTAVIPWITFAGATAFGVYLLVLLARRPRPPASSE